MSAMLAGVVIHLAAAFLLGLGAVCLVRPALAGRLLLGFASTLRWHLLELAARMLVGGAAVLHAEQAHNPAFFQVLGWGLIATTAVLSCVPWQLHRRFAVMVVPVALRYVRALGVSAIALGCALALAY